MGVTIHYRGRLRRKEELSNLTEEVVDLCKSAGWKHTIWKGDPLAGVTFQVHPDCELVWMTVDQNGNLQNILTLNVDDNEFEPWNFTKTQFANVETHVAICNVLRFLGDKYFEDWEVDDEGRYYETGDLEYLTRVMSFLNAAIKDMAESLTTMPVEPGASLEEHVMGIAQKFKERNG